MSTPLTPEQLLTYTQFVRRVARALVDDDATADDVTQQTLLRALSRAAGEVARPAAWLRGLVRSVAHHWRLAEERRTAREQRAARPESIPDSTQSLEREQVLQQLTAAIVDLPEPFRSTIFQRYFDDLSAAEIAARSGVPLATVRSRLQRAVDLLRERLGRSDVDRPDAWRASLLLLAGVSRPAASSLAAAGVLLMTTRNVVLGVVLLVMASGAWFLWRAADVPAEPAAPSTAAAPNDPIVPLSRPAASRAVIPLAVVPFHEPAPAESRPASLPARPSATLRGRCVGAENGTPIAGCKVTLTGKLSGANTPTETDASAAWPVPPTVETGTDGRFEIAFEPRAGYGFSATIDHRARVGAQGWWKGVNPGDTIDLGDLRLVRGQRVSGQLLDTQGRAVRDWRIDDGRNGPFGYGDGKLAALSATARTDANGHFAFDRPLTPGKHTPVPASPARLTAAESNLITVGDDGSELHVDLVAEVPDQSTMITGIVVDETGAPVTQASILGVAADGKQSGAFAGREGRFSVPKRYPDQGPVRIGVTSAVGCEPLPPGEPVAWGTTDVRLVLRRGGVIDLTVRRPGGAPVTRFAVRCEPAADQSRAFDRAGILLPLADHSGGRAQIGGVLRGPQFLVVVGAGGETVTEHLTMPPDGRLERTLDLPADAAVVVQVRTPDGDFIAGAAVELLLRNGAPAPTWWGSRGEPVQPTHKPLTAASAIEVAHARTDATGTATLRAAAGAEVWASVHGSGAIATVVGPRVVGDRAEPWVIEIARGATLTGVIGPAGAVAKLTVQGRRPFVDLVDLDDAERRVQLREKWEDVVAADDGRYRVVGVPPGHWRIALRGWNDMKMFGVSEKVLAPDLGVIDVTDASTIERPLDVTAVLNAPPPVPPPFRK